MSTRHPDAGHEEVATASSDHAASKISWLRVALVVAVVTVVGTLALHASITASLDPKEPYGIGAVTIAGQTHDARVCESLENGIEITYGPHSTMLYVHNMGPAEIYEGLEVEPARTDGTYLVRRADGAELWSHKATVLERTTDGSIIEATFDEIGPVTVAYDTGGWCDGADPNVGWR